ncbi:unnamed protein product [Boreogadus saida]
MLKVVFYSDVGGRTDGRTGSVPEERRCLPGSSRLVITGNDTLRGWKTPSHWLAAGVPLGPAKGPKSAGPYPPTA